MILPNKLFSYNQSVLSKIPMALYCLENPIHPIELYKSMRNIIDTPMEFMDVLDCLYALNKIDTDAEGRLFRC